MHLRQRHFPAAVIWLGIDAGHVVGNRAAVPVFHGQRQAHEHQPSLLHGMPQEHDLPVVLSPKQIGALDKETLVEVPTRDLDLVSVLLAVLERHSYELPHGEEQTCCQSG